MNRRRKHARRDRPAYRERTWAPAWALNIWIGVSLAMAALAVVLGRGEGAEVAFLVIGSKSLILSFIVLTFLRLDVEVRPDHLLVRFGPIRLWRKRIAYEDVKAVSALTFRPLAEFGGWGIRWAFKGKRVAWTIRGKRAVRLTIEGGKEVLVGSTRPQSLEQQIRTAMRAKR